jgi:4-diphosphocytidyl-2C-methyl-D-erythritol kinase
VARRHPQIALLVAQLRDAGCGPAMMSGSGSSVFGVLPPSMESVGGREWETAASEVRTVITRTSDSVGPVSLLP